MGLVALPSYSFLKKDLTRYLFDIVSLNVLLIRRKCQLSILDQQGSSDAEDAAHMLIHM